MCLPYRDIESIKGKIRLENPDDKYKLTNQDIDVIIDTLRYTIVHFNKQNFKSYPFDIKEWLDYRREIIKKLEILKGD